MAQKVTGYVKLQIPAGKATPAPPVGPALGQHGVNIAAFTKEFNERTKNDVGMIIPVIITVYADRSFTFITKTPPPPHDCGDGKDFMWGRLDGKQAGEQRNEDHADYGHTSARHELLHSLAFC